MIVRLSCYYCDYIFCRQIIMQGPPLNFVIFTQFTPMPRPNKESFYIHVAGYSVTVILHIFVVMEF